MRINVPALPPFQLHSALQLIFTLAASLFTLRLGAGLVAWRAANVLEKPSYAVVKRLPASPPSRGCVEVRQYAPYLIAETTVDEPSVREAGRMGFGKCAGYIFGKNRPREKGAEAEKMARRRRAGSGGGGGSGKTKISFVIGSKYDLSTAPKPIDTSVKVKKVPGHYLAARSFPGPPPSDERISKEKEAILQTLEKEGIRAKEKDQTLVYGYHDPVVTPNFLRKNEVAVYVDGSSVQ
ncbi:hypothetical protein ACHAXT_013201 [Thalassiosira profunda]